MTGRGQADARASKSLLRRPAPGPAAPPRESGDAGARLKAYGPLRKPRRGRPLRPSRRAPALFPSMAPSSTSQSASTITYRRFGPAVSLPGTNACRSSALLLAFTPSTGTNPVVLTAGRAGAAAPAAHGAGAAASVQVAHTATVDALTAGPSPWLNTVMKTWIVWASPETGMSGLIEIAGAPDGPALTTRSGMPASV
jgi:hypothetical protein